MKRQITDSISENLTDSDLESGITQVDKPVQRVKIPVLRIENKKQ